MAQKTLILNEIPEFSFREWLAEQITQATGDVMKKFEPWVYGICGNSLERLLYRIRGPCCYSIVHFTGKKLLKQFGS